LPPDDQSNPLGVPSYGDYIPPPGIRRNTPASAPILHDHGVDQRE
jgi:hypothetical protein